MSPFELSVMAWIGGGIVGGIAGSALAKQRPVAGFALGAILVGAISDKLIERYHPQYTGHERFSPSPGYDFAAFRARGELR